MEQSNTKTFVNYILKSHQRYILTSKDIFWIYNGTFQNMFQIFADSMDDDWLFKNMMKLRMYRQKLIYFLFLDIFFFGYIPFWIYLFFDISFFGYIFFWIYHFLVISFFEIYSYLDIFYFWFWIYSFWIYPFNFLENYIQL